MEKIANSIKELLSESNRVIVPEFGAFIGKNISAKIDDAKNIVYPPSKKVSFNDRLKLNDENLAKYIAANNNIEITKAKSEIAEFVNAIKNKLDVDGGVSIEGLGSFEMNGTNIAYKQDEQVNFSGESLELNPVRLPGRKEVAAEVLAERDALKADEKIAGSASMSDAAIERRRKRREQMAEEEEESRTPIWLFILPFFILLLLGYLIYNLMFKDGDFKNPFASKDKIEEVDNKLEEGPVKFGKPTPKAPSIVNNSSNRNTKTDINRNNYNSRSKKSTKSYGAKKLGKWGSLYTKKKGNYIIVGSVQDKAMAEKMAVDLRAFDQYEAYVLSGPSGYNRIAIYSGNDQGNADKLLARLQKGYSPDCWVFKQKNSGYFEENE